MTRVCLPSQSSCRPQAEAAAAPEAADHDEVAADKYTLHRILNGVAEGVTEIVPLHALPMESNLDIMGAGELTNQSSC